MSVHRSLAWALAGFASLATAQEFKLSKEGPEVKVDAAEGVDFSSYETFAWSQSQKPASNPANHIRITRAVERELRAKGLRPAGDEAPHLRLHYFGRIETKLKGRSRQASTYVPTADVKTIVDFSRVKEGTLILELIEGKGDRIVWRGVATEPVSPPDETEAQINRMVKALLERYPPER
ncbi:MAG TPA: DUF4136 domain-containing protein [Vicinamibacteria bacterium]|nr:DUF4136 domain-containing protein [Vicinamibacteria bacterium]